MKKINAFLMAACALIAVACSSGSDDLIIPPTPQPQPTPAATVKFYPTLSSMTRATETAFENYDDISVFAVQPSAGASLKASGNYAHNVRYTYLGDAFTTENGINLPDDDQGLAYYAVYPYQMNASNQGVFSVYSDQQSHSRLTLSDFCTAYTPATTSQDVWLNFSHRLSRICIELTGDNLASKSISIRLNNVCYEMSYDLNANSYYPTGNKTDILMGETYTNNFEAIVVPQTVYADADFIVFTIDGEEFYYSFENDVTFRSGKEYDYAFTYTENRIVLIRGDINPWNTIDERLNNVVPEDIQAKMEEHMPIYTGVNPPNIEGTYFMDPFETVFCEDYGSGGYESGYIINSYYCQFLNQNFENNTIDYKEASSVGSDSSVGNGAFISGSGNNFTAFFDTSGESQGISTRTALVISGTKTSEGIEDLYYAFVMVEKGDDPNHELMNEGIFRVFRDQDGLSVNASWPATTRVKSQSNNWNAPWATVVGRKK